MNCHTWKGIKNQQKKIKFPNIENNIEKNQKLLIIEYENKEKYINDKMDLNFKSILIDDIINNNNNKNENENENNDNKKNDVKSFFNNRQISLNENNNNNEKKK
jgi:hypothetical protein